MEKEIITSQALYGYEHYLYGEAYYGSYKGMRYRVARDPLEKVVFADEAKRQEGQFMVTIWPEPHSFENTPDEKKQSFYFPFTEEGRQQVLKCINEQYFSNKAIWDEAL